jgi:hypothetical protein
MQFMIVWALFSRSAMRRLLGGGGNTTNDGCVSIRPPNLPPC